MIWIGSHNQTQTKHSRESLEKNSGGTHQTPHKNYVFNASLLFRCDTKPGAQELWSGLCIILYSFLFAGSVDEDHERDGLSALCSYKGPD